MALELELERWLKWIGWASRVVVVVMVEVVVGVEGGGGLIGVRRTRGMILGCGGAGLDGPAGGSFLGSSSEQCSFEARQGLHGSCGLRLFSEHLRFASVHAVHFRYRLLAGSAGAAVRSGWTTTSGFVLGLPSLVIRVLV